MSLLPRREQAKLLRKIATLMKQTDLHTAIESVANDYSDEGLIKPKELGLKSLRDIRDFPIPAILKRRLFKGYITEEIKAIAKQITKGIDATVAFKNSPLFDKDIASIIALSLKANQFYEVSAEVYNLIKKENKFLSEINKILITPAMSSILAWAFIAVVSVKTIPAFMKGLGGEEALPTLPRLLYIYFGKNPWFLLLGFLLTLFLIVLAFKTNEWKVKLIPAFKTFEKFRFITAFRTLYPVSPNLIELNKLLMQANLSKKWTDALQKISQLTAKGIKPVKAYSVLKRDKLIKSSEFTFFEIALQTSNMNALRDLENELEIDMEDSVEKSKTIINLATLTILGAIVIGLYIGIIVSLMIKVQHQF
jgi:type II secretory pathway component PulF